MTPRQIRIDKNERGEFECWEPEGMGPSKHALFATYPTMEEAVAQIKRSYPDVRKEYIHKESALFIVHTPSPPARRPRPAIPATSTSDPASGIISSRLEILDPSAFLAQHAGDVGVLATMKLIEERLESSIAQIGDQVLALTAKRTDAEEQLATLRRGMAAMRKKK